MQGDRVRVDRCRAHGFTERHRERRSIADTDRSVRGRNAGHRWRCGVGHEGHNVVAAASREDSILEAFYPVEGISYPIAIASDRADQTPARHWHHCLDAGRTGAGKNRETHLIGVPGDRSNRRAIARIQPGQQLAGRNNRHPVVRRRRKDRIRHRLGVGIRVHVRHKRPVIPL